jgi:hypothetical protein
MKKLKVILPQLLNLVLFQLNGNQLILIKSLLKVIISFRILVPKSFYILLAVTLSKWDFDQESAGKGTESLYEDLAETSQTSSDNHHINNE